ncbi:hypothetical protein [uncultured Mediterranean phage]|nr:hypothetical protein [uncultured Mediterranean phage]
MTLSQAEIETAVDRMRDPRFFLEEVLGVEHTYPKQIEMMAAVRDYRRAACVGCNSSGKDWTAGRIALWWQTTNYPAKTIVTGPTGRQVDDIVWNELRHAYNNARTSWSSRLYETPRLQMDEDHFAIGFSTDRAYNLQGFHSPNLLVIVTEAHAVAQADIDALRRLNPTRMLFTGNPFAQAGEFYDAFHGSRDLYETVQISAYDTPNVIEERVVIPGMVTLQDIQDRAEEWGEESPMYQAAILGAFPDNLDDNLVTLASASAAALRTSQGEGPRILATDVARMGVDKTVSVLRQGNAARIVRRVQGHDTMRTAGAIAELAALHEVDLIVVDAVGVGAGVYDRLREGSILVNGEEVGLKAPLVAFTGGAKASKPRRFQDQNAECWWSMREWFLTGEADIDDDKALIGQVVSRGYEIQSDQRIKLESKAKLSKSPDEADALAMTFVHRTPWRML